jgi:hypothetical protein
VRDHLVLDPPRRRARARQQARQHRQPLPGRQVPHGERHGDVLARRQMRVQRIGLEHHGDVTAGRPQARDIAAVDGDAAVIGALDPGDDAHQGRLAATRRPEQGDELAGRDVQRHATQRIRRAEALAQIRDGDARHTASVLSGADA